jgi:hypothetical protein
VDGCIHHASSVEVEDPGGNGFAQSWGECQCNTSRRDGTAQTAKAQEDGRNAFWDEFDQACPEPVFGLSEEEPLECVVDATHGWKTVRSSADMDQAL